MSDDAASEWLAVAATDLAHYPADILSAACSAARRECTWHGNIVPLVVKTADAMLRERRSIVAARIPPERQIERTYWKPEPGELEAIKAQVARDLSG